MDIANINTPEGRIEHLSTMAREIAAADISQDELGSALGFHEAEEAKNHLCAYVLDILDRAKLQQERLNDVVLDQSLQQVAAALKQVQTNIDHIQKLVEQGPHNEKFPTQRTNYIAAIQKQLTTSKQQIHAFELDLKLCEIGETLAAQDYLAESKGKAEQAVIAAEAAAGKVETVLLNLQNKSAGQGVSESQSHFGDLKSGHRRFEWSWFTAFVVATAGAGCAIYHIVLIEPPDLLTVKFGVAFLQKALLLSAAGVAMRLSLAKYNTERKLRIVYEHREKVLDQYRSFEAGIGDDNPEAKNAFRLEIAKYIFSDPKSGYDESSSASTEINLNPIIGAVETIAKK